MRPDCLPEHLPDIELARMYSARENRDCRVKSKSTGRYESLSDTAGTRGPRPLQWAATKVDHQRFGSITRRRNSMSKLLYVTFHGGKSGITNIVAWNKDGGTDPGHPRGAGYHRYRP